MESSGSKSIDETRIDIRATIVVVIYVAGYTVTAVLFPAEEASFKSSLYPRRWAEDHCRLDRRCSGEDLDYLPYLGALRLAVVATSSSSSSPQQRRGVRI